MYDPIDPEFRPYLDGTWVTDYPTDSFRRGEFHKVPVITGTVQNEFGEDKQLNSNNLFLCQFIYAKLVLH